ncbi:ABC transporter permease [Paenibacillus shenyangensis]|uniref:ABC transporter permease n=1 Tax=Paenibacillus sp. A9 TaxID=1284352 RepID=UPI0003757E7E|nr:ABC transporter permease [Paenibacillus sp. A9]
MKSLLDEWNYLIKSKYPIIAIMFPLVAVLAYTLLLPSSQINESRVVVVDQDNTAYSRQLIQKIDSSQYIHVAQVVSYAEHPEEYFYHEQYLAVISLPKGLEDNHNRAISNRLGLILDNTNSQSVTFIRTAMQEITATENMQLSVPALARTGMSSTQAQGTLSNLAVEVRSLFNPTSNYQNTTILTFVCMFSFMMLNINSLPIVARLRVSHRLAGELQNPFNLLFRIIPYLLFSTAGLIFAMGVLKLFDDTRFVGSPFLFMIPVMLYVFGSVCINILVAWGAAHPGIAVSRMIFIFMPAFVLSGGTMARALFPPLALQISDFFPFVWMFKFLRSLGLRGAPFSEMLPELGSMMLYTGVLAMLVIARGLWEKQKLAKQAAVAPAGGFPGGPPPGAGRPPGSGAPPSSSGSSAAGSMPGTSGSPGPHVLPGGPPAPAHEPSRS